MEFLSFFFSSYYYYYFLLFISFLFVSNLFFKKSKNQPPGPTGLPILGHLHLLNTLLPQTLKHLSDRYGPVLLLRFGSTPVLFVSSPSAIEECLTKNDVIFANRPSIIAGKHLGYDFSSLEWSSYGPHWRNLRRFTNTEVFSSTGLQSSFDIRKEEVQYMIHELFKKCLPTNKFLEFDTKDMFFELVFNFIMKLVSGKRYSGKINWSPNVVKETFMPERLLYFADFLPFLKWFDYEGCKRSLLGMRRRKDEFLEGLIEEKKMNRKMLSGYNHEETTKINKEKAMIDVLLDLQDKEPKTYADEIIKGVISLMFTAGIDTQLVTLISTMSLLIENPQALAKLRAEIDLHVEEGHLLTESDLPKLPYLQCVINESLRLHPPAPVPAPHYSSQECTVAGYNIPPGTMLFMNVWAIHRDPKLWDEPLKFKPERFQNNGAREGRTDLGFKWLPFSSGRRGCPGNGLAMRIVSLAVGSLVQCFEWKNVGDDVLKVKMEEGRPSSRAMCRPRTDKIDVLSNLYEL